MCLHVHVKLVSALPPTEPQLAEFPPYYKSSYAWDHVPSPYDFRQMSFPPSLLQHASSLYGAHLKQSSELPQPLDCSTHYSPTSNTYHCITCDKVIRHARCVYSLRLLVTKKNLLKRDKTRLFFYSPGVLHPSWSGGSRQTFSQRYASLWL